MMTLSVDNGENEVSEWKDDRMKGLLNRGKDLFHETFCGSSDSKHFTANSLSFKSTCATKEKIKEQKGKLFLFLPAKSY